MFPSNGTLYMIMLLKEYLFLFVAGSCAWKVCTCAADVSWLKYSKMKLTFDRNSLVRSTHVRSLSHYFAAASTLSNRYIMAIHLSFILSRFETPKTHAHAIPQEAVIALVYYAVLRVKIWNSDTRERRVNTREQKNNNVHTCIDMLALAFQVFLLLSPFPRENSGKC